MVALSFGSDSTLLYLWRLFIFYRPMEFSKNRSLFNCQSSCIETIHLAGCRFVIADDPISHRWIFCAGQFATHAHPGEKKLEHIIIVLAHRILRAIFKHNE